MSSLLIIGCGSIGRHLARYYRDRGERVQAVVRRPESAAALATEGIAAWAMDLSRELSQEALGQLPARGARVFHLAPPPAVGTPDVHTRHLIAGFAQAGQPSRIIYVSTTGVYGDCGGDWVDEDRPVNPQVDRARRRWDAEQVLGQWRRDSGGTLVTLRVAGIYGPGRLPLERLRAGLPLVRPEDAPWSNRIHADDLVATCIAAMERGGDGAVYNVCDGHPSTMTDYFFQVADAVGLPRPPAIRLDEADGRLSAGMLSYLRESRRLSNRRLVEDLGVRLRYPTLAQGLAACR